MKTEASLNMKKNVVLAFESSFLFLALLDGWPYGFFTFLRFVILICSIYVAWIFYTINRELLAWVFGLIAILFNPFIPIYLSRPTWKTIDFVIGIFFVASIFLLNGNKKN